MIEKLKENEDENMKINEELYNYKQYAVLYVDDQQGALDTFKDAFKDMFTIYTAPNAIEGYKILEEKHGEIGIVMSDQRMPGENGDKLLTRIRAQFPDILRIIVTGYSDIGAAINAINSSAIYKYICKPWNMSEVKVTLMHALQFFIIKKQADSLASERLSVLERTLYEEKVKAFGLVTTGISGHVKNSLAAMTKFINLARKKVKGEDLEPDNLNDPDYWNKITNHTVEQINKISEMFDDISLVKKEGASSFKDIVALNETVDNVCKRLKAGFAGHNMTVKNNIPVDLPLMHVDKKRFFKIFELLLKNEINFMPDGTNIVINARVSDEKINGEPLVEIEVKDDGPALPADELRAVFNPFAISKSKNKQPQCGLYLVACFFMAHHHDGDIDIKRESNKGNTFTIRLPIQPTPMSLQSIRNQFLNEVLLNDMLWQRYLARSI